MNNLQIIYKNRSYELENMTCKYLKNKTSLIYLFLNKDSKFIDNYDFYNDNIISLKTNEKVLNFKITLVRQLGYNLNLKYNNICYLMVLEGEFYNETKT